MATPRLFGPTRRVPAVRQVASSSSDVCSSPPSAASTTSARTSPRDARACAAAGTSARGSATTARSTGPATPASSSPGRTTCIAPAKPWRLSSSAPPTVPGRAEAVSTITVAGRRTCCTAATAASRSRLSNVWRPCSVREVGKRTCSSPGCELTSTGKPESRKTPIIRWLLGSVTAVNTSTPCSAASSARWESSVVASPRPCHSPSTANAISASSGRVRAHMPWPTTRSGEPVRTSSARPSGGATESRAATSKFTAPEKKRNQRAWSDSAARKSRIAGASSGPAPRIRAVDPSRRTTSYAAVPLIAGCRRSAPRRPGPRGDPDGRSRSAPGRARQSTVRVTWRRRTR